MRRIQSTKRLQNSSYASRAKLQTCNDKPWSAANSTYGRSACVQRSVNHSAPHPSPSQHAHESRPGRCQGSWRDAGQPAAAGRQPGPGAHDARATDLPVIAEARAAGVATLSGIAKALTARGVPTPSGRGAWSPATVMRLDRRVQAA